VKGRYLAFVREATWFGRERAVGYGRVVVLAFLPSLVWYYLQAFGPDGTDFLAFWSAARLTLAGDPAAAYDPAAMQGLQQALGRETWFPFLNPPPFLAVVLPFGALPLAWALPAWVVVTYAAWLFAARRLVPGGFWPIAAYPGAMMAAWHAQSGLLVSALLIGGLANLARRPILSGVLFGALVIKPQTALLLPIALAAAGQWRTFAAAAVTAALLTLASVVVFGPQTIAGFLAVTDTMGQLLGAPSDASLLRQATVFAAVALWTGLGPAMVVQAAFSLAMIAIVWRVWRGPGDPLGKAAVFAIAAVLATPYLYQYDLPLLILPVCWWVRDAMRTGWRAWERVGLAAFYWSPLVLRALAFPLGVNLTPWALTAALLILMTRLRAAGG